MTPPPLFDFSPRLSGWGISVKFASEARLGESLAVFYHKASRLWRGSQKEVVG